MVVVLLAPQSPVTAATPFPRAAVEGGLRGELVDAVRAEASLRGVGLPADPAAVTHAAFQVDSLVVVSILCAVEPVLGLELPESVVRMGGYRSVEDAVGQLLPRIEAVWNKRMGITP